MKFNKPSGRCHGCVMLVLKYFMYLGSSVVGKTVETNTSVFVSWGCFVILIIWWLFMTKSCGLDRGLYDFFIYMYFINYSKTACVNDKVLCSLPLQERESILLVMFKCISSVCC